MKKTRLPVLTPAVRKLAVGIINKTPDGSVGYDEAAHHVSETWDQFEQAGATSADLNNITGFIRWAKWEGFCIGSTL